MEGTDEVGEVSVAYELVSASVDVLRVVLDGATGPNRLGRSFKACPIPVCEGERLHNGEVRGHGKRGTSSALGFSGCVCIKCICLVGAQRERARGTEE